MPVKSLLSLFITILDEGEHHFYNISMGNLIEEMNNTSP